MEARIVVRCCQIVDRSYTPEMGRTSDARERLIDSARELIHDQGYEAIGVGEICRNAGVNKGSFYYFFKSKQLLGLAAIDEHWARTRGNWISILQGPGGPLRRIERLFQGLYRRHDEAKKSCGHAIGCLLGNMSLERSTHDPEIRRRLRAIFAEQELLLVPVFKEAAAAGQLADGLTPKKAASAVIAFMQGVVMQAKLHDDPRLIRSASKHVLRMVAA
jgi:TetR/AcrR family transcriptional repressor of nem operon